MADLGITGSQVLRVSGPIEHGTAGEALTAGMAVYLTTASTWKKADANVSAVEAAAGGIALDDAATGQPVTVQRSGVINLGAAAAAAAGSIYCVSNVAGKICPSTDKGSGDYVTVLGIGIGANKVKLALNPSGATIP